MLTSAPGTLEPEHHPPCNVRIQGMTSKRSSFLRDLEAGPLLDLVLLMSVTSVLAIRFYLHVSGYPQVGGDALHIAHMLWGGLFMLASVVMLLAFLDRDARRVAAVLGGIGFGTFIDEVGKFITHDNDYFYQPAVSVIYVVFVLIYLGVRALQGRLAASGAEYLANALHTAGELAADDLDRRERDRAVAYLDASGDRGALATSLREALRAADLVADRRDGPLRRIALQLVGWYRQVATRPWFGWALVTFFAVQLAFRLLHLAMAARWLAPTAAPTLTIPLVSTLPADPEDFAVAHWLQLGSSGLAAVFVSLGMAQIFRDRLRALRMFQRATVVTLCLTQVFVFYRVEWLGLVELTGNLLIFAGLRFAIGRER